MLRISNIQTLRLRCCYYIIILRSCVKRISTLSGGLSCSLENLCKPLKIKGKMRFQPSKNLFSRLRKIFSQPPPPPLCRGLARLWRRKFEVCGKRQKWGSGVSPLVRETHPYSQSTFSAISLYCDCLGDTNLVLSTKAYRQSSEWEPSLSSFNILSTSSYFCRIFFVNLSFEIAHEVLDGVP